MGTPRFTPEFKEEAVRQITERGYSVAEVSNRLGVSTHSLDKWLRAMNRAAWRLQIENPAVCLSLNCHTLCEICMI